MSYSADQIEVLEGLEPVRKRPAMYIGGTDRTGYHHLLWEIVDNCVDEAINGHASRIEVTIDADWKGARVSDNGRGIPVDKHPKFKKSALELILCTLHAGGKFGGKGYAVSGGLHGVGSSVVNALSERLDGPDHPQVALVLVNLGLLLERVGEDAEARRVHARALQIRERALGAEHPALANPLLGVARVALDQGELEVARQHAERALALRRGPAEAEGFEVVQALVPLGMVAARTGDAAAAREHLERALAICGSHPCDDAVQGQACLELAAPVRVFAPPAAEAGVVARSTARARPIVRALIGSTPRREAAPASAWRSGGTPASRSRRARASPRTRRRAGSRPGPDRRAGRRPGRRRSD